jgi:hypothetical protein
MIHSTIVVIIISIGQTAAANITRTAPKQHYNHDRHGDDPFAC